MNVTQVASITTYKAPSRPLLIRVRPNTPTYSPGNQISNDITARKIPENVGLYFLNITLAPQTIIR